MYPPRFPATGQVRYALLRHLRGGMDGSLGTSRQVRARRSLQDVSADPPYTTVVRRRPTIAQACREISGPSQPLFSSLFERELCS
jgi:hypothetical protein